MYAMLDIIFIIFIYVKLAVLAWHDATIYVLYNIMYVVGGKVTG